jgi:hypothetical protein
MSDREKPDQEASASTADEPAQVASIDQARKQITKKPSGLTAFERQLLLDEVAKISAEICDLQVWAAEITRRVTNPAGRRTDRTA